MWDSLGTGQRGGTSHPEGGSVDKGNRKRLSEISENRNPTPKEKAY